MKTWIAESKVAHSRVLAQKDCTVVRSREQVGNSSDTLIYPTTPSDHVAHVFSVLLHLFKTNSGFQDLTSHQSSHIDFRMPYIVHENQLVSPFPKM